MITGLGAIESLARGKKNALYSTLEEFHKYWERIDIVAPRANGKKSEVFFGNVHIHYSPLPIIFHPIFFIFKSISIYKIIHFDFMTVHEFPPFYNGIGARIVSWLTGVPYILEIMHIPGVPRAINIKEKIYSKLVKWFIAIDASSARAVRVINQKETKDFLIKAGVPALRIHYIPAFYIDLDIFKPEVTAKKYDLVYAARLERNKGIINFLQAVSVLKEKKPDLKICIIGDGPLRSDIESYINQHQLKECVELAGWLDGPQDVAKLFNQSRVFVNPSLNEGGPRVALEAMACGLPVVTTRVGVMLDIIKDGENGLMCDWDSQSMAGTILKMIDSSELQKKCSEAGISLTQQFERTLAIKNYAEALNNLT